MNSQSQVGGEKAGVNVKSIKVKFPSGLVASLLFVLTFIATGCEPLHREIEAVWDIDAGEEFDDVDFNGNGANNCTPGGECGPCGFGEYICSDGIRVCLGPIDLDVEDEHCGQCDNACVQGTHCENGQCVADGECTPGASCGPCGNGVISCDDQDVSSCQGAVDLEIDDENCGQCQFICQGATSCVNGQCLAAVVGELSAVACVGRLELIWDEMAGAESYVVEWSGGVVAEEGASGLDVGDVQSVSLRFSQNVQDVTFYVVGRSGGADVGRTDDVDVTVPQQDTGAVVDNGDELIVPAGAVYTVSGQVEKAQQISVDGTLCVEPHDGVTAGSVHLIAPVIEIGPGGAISATAAGYQGGTMACSGQPGNGASGASYGGLGHINCFDGGGLYGEEATREIEMGSGGGGSSEGAGPGGGGYSCGVRSLSGGRGGGAIHLQSQTSLIVAGMVLANGTGSYGDCGGGVPDGGAGSGGGILLEGGGINLEQTAVLSAAGGSLGQPGGGGRIKIFDVPTISAEARLSASGGGGNSQAGTVHIE